MMKEKSIFRSGVFQVPMLVLFLIPASGVTVHDAPTQEERDSIKATALAIGEELASVTYAVGWYEGTPYYAGSVVILNRTTAISAAHASIFKDGDGGEFPFEEIKIGFGNMFTTFDNGGPFYSVTTAHRHPVHDLVVYDFTDDPLPEDVATTAVHGGSLSTGDLVHFAGVGKFSHEGGAEDRDGNKYGFRGYIQDHRDNRFAETYVYSRFTRSTFGNTFHAEGGAGNTGDSGGGVFLKLADDSYHLVGITEVVTAFNRYGSHTGFLPLSLPDVQSFLAPFLEEPPGGVVENPLLDDDGDSENNLAEYAFGSDPKNSASRPRFERALRGSGEERIMVVSYLRRTDGTVLYEGEASRDLETWSPATPCDPLDNLPPAPTGYEWVACCLPYQNTPGYLRIRARLAEP